MATPQGPNLRELIVWKMSLLTVPPGGGIASAAEALATPGRIGEIAKEATAWAEASIRLVKAIPGNPYGDDDEAIAGAILRRIDRKAKARKPWARRMAEAAPEEPSR